MHQDHPHIECVQQIDVMRQGDKLALAHHLATKRDDKGTPTKSVNIWRSGAKPGHEMLSFEFCILNCHAPAPTPLIPGKNHFAIKS